MNAEPSAQDLCVQEAEEYLRWLPAHIGSVVFSCAVLFPDVSIATIERIAINRFRGAILEIYGHDPLLSAWLIAKLEQLSLTRLHSTKAFTTN